MPRSRSHGLRGADTLPGPVVRTAAGCVRGLRTASPGLHFFGGVPYAQPPVGPLRFMPPLRPLPWSGVLDCSAFGPAAAQHYDPKEAPLSELVDGAGDETVAAAPGAGIGDEDCLTLNIWTPAPDRARRPVLVWIHGGANWLESSRLHSYHGDALCRRGGVVMVSLNYRLGLFGFLDLSVLGNAAFDGSHSNGLRDQLMAIDWVHDNIEAFGGDPDQVTLMGESAGSMDLSWLLAGGHLRGRARRVALMSGVGSLGGAGGRGPHAVHSLATGRRRAADHLARLGIDSLPQLLACSTRELLQRQAQVVAASDTLFDMDTLFYPRVHAPFTPLAPLPALHGGAADGMDLLIGFTAYEMGLWLLWDEQLDRRDAGELARRVPGLDETAADQAAALYTARFPHGDAGMHLLGDAFFVMPSLWAAEAHARRGGRAWVYRFDWLADARRRALHASDQLFFFGTHDCAGGRQLLGEPADNAERQARDALARESVDGLIAFVTTGDPRPPGSRLAAWAPYDTVDRPLMSLGGPSGPQRLDDPYAERRVWWTRQVLDDALKAADE